MKRSAVTGLVLCGGASRRMQALGGDVDKGLLELDGRPLVRHAIDRLAPQVDALLLVANAHFEAYRRFGPTVIRDAAPPAAAVAPAAHQGPVAGLLAGLDAIAEVGPAAGLDPVAGARDGADRWLVTVPCDCPELPTDLVTRLIAAAEAAGTDAAIARTPARCHPVFALVRSRARPAVAAAFDAGERRMQAVLGAVGYAEARFEDEAAFANLNTPDELAAARARAAAGQRPAGPRGPDATGLDAGGPPAPGLGAAGLGAAGSDWSVEAARAMAVEAAVPVAGLETVPLGRALGRVLAADLLSPLDVPPHDNAAMDGYAIRVADLAADAAVALAVAGRALAGRPFAGCLRAGEAIRIMTGAPLPAGADAVVPQEETTRAADDRVLIGPGPRRGQHCRRRGEDLAAGGIALSAGRLLGPADLGLAASLGLGTLTVRRRARVAVLSTGDELACAGEAPGPGRIFDSNRVMLLTAVERLGLQAIDGGLVPDRPEALADALSAAAAGADAILSSGGVSVGDADHTRRVMAALGEVRFASVAMRPGRPLAVGRLGRSLYVGLPGNPVAVLVAFHFIVRDALLRLAGASPRPLPRFPVRSRGPLKKRPGRMEFQRGRLVTGADGVLEVDSTGPQGSGILRSMSEADAIIVLAAERGNVAAGEPVDVVPFHGLI